MKKNQSELAQSSSFVNFLKSLKNLELSLSVPIQEARDLSGIIKDFEMAYELSWKVIKKFLASAGHQTLGAKDVYSKAFQLGYLDQEKAWLQMIEDRNQTAHIYDATQAAKIVERIKSLYWPELKKLETKLAVW